VYVENGFMNGRRKVRIIKAPAASGLCKKVEYKEISEHALKALFKEFAYPETRRRIYEEIVKGLGKDLKLDVLYKLLSKEPVLTS
jgi:hypothetical protein